MTKALQPTLTQWCSPIPEPSSISHFSTTSDTPVPSGPTPQTSVNLSGWILLPLLCEYYIDDLKPNWSWGGNWPHGGPG